MPMEARPRPIRAPAVIMAPQRGLMSRSSKGVESMWGSLCGKCRSHIARAKQAAEDEQDARRYDEEAAATAARVGAVWPSRPVVAPAATAEHAARSHAEAHRSPPWVC